MRVATPEMTNAPITGSRSPAAVAPSTPATAGPRMKPRFEETASRPKFALRSASDVMSAKYAFATDTLPPVRPSRARARNSTSNGSVSVNRPSAGASTAASALTGSARATRKIPHDANVPIWLTSSTRLRPTRSDQRPSSGAPINWKAE